MRSRTWLNCFLKSLKECRQNDSNLLADFTSFMGKVMDKTAKKLNCFVVQRRQKNAKYSYEYLGIDAFFIDLSEYEDHSDEDCDPFVLPKAVVELENSYSNQKISYCLWKILCIRSSLKVLICYQKKEKIQELKVDLENIIWTGSLMKGSNSDLLIIIGDESSLETESWENYYSVFEWRNDKLEEIPID